MNTAHNKVIPITRDNPTMQSSLPEPLTPPEADLTGFEWAEFNSDRMQRSNLWIDSTGDEFKAWFALWMYAQGEKPAGTLPNNERRLSRIVAMAGVTDWESVKDMALHGWVLCNDDRYHHPVVAEAVQRAWDKRLDFIAQQNDAKRRKQAERDKRRAMIAAIRDAGGKAEWNETTIALTAKYEALDLSHTCHSDASQNNSDLSRTCHAPVTPKTGTGTGTGTGTVNNIFINSGAGEKASGPKPAEQKQPPSAKKQKTSLPPNFAISPEVQVWADKNGYSHLPERLENFVLAAERNGYQYTSWDAAFKTAIREDWAKLNGQKERLQGGIHSGFDKIDYTKGIGPNGEF
jgi:hypothetical protein